MQCKRGVQAPAPAQAGCGRGGPGRSGPGHPVALFFFFCVAQRCGRRHRRVHSSPWRHAAVLAAPCPCTVLRRARACLLARPRALSAQLSRIHSLCSTLSESSPCPSPFQPRVHLRLRCSGPMSCPVQYRHSNKCPKEGTTQASCQMKTDVV